MCQQGGGRDRLLVCAGGQDRLLVCTGADECVCMCVCASVCPLHVPTCHSAKGSLLHSRDWAQIGCHSFHKLIANRWSGAESSSGSGLQFSSLCLSRHSSSELCVGVSEIAFHYITGLIQTFIINVHWIMCLHLFPCSTTCQGDRNDMLSAIREAGYEDTIHETRVMISTDYGPWSSESFYRQAVDGGREMTS